MIRNSVDKNAFTTIFIEQFRSGRNKKYIFQHNRERYCYDFVVYRYLSLNMSVLTHNIYYCSIDYELTFLRFNENNILKMTQ